MSVLEKNRLIGTAFLVLGFFHLVILVLSLFGYSLTYPYVGSAPELPGSKLIEKESKDSSENSFGVPGFSGVRNSTQSTASAAAPENKENKAQIEAKRTITMIYVMLGVQFAILLFILFAGFTVVNLRAGGRSLGIVASLFLLFFYPLGTLFSILAIWFLTGDECLELYSEVEKDKRAPQSII
jgi:hypothetical protein